MKIILLATLITANLLTATAMAQGKNKRFGEHYADTDIYKKLDLSKQQQRQIRKIFQSAGDKGDLEKHFKKRQAIMAKRQAIIESPTFDKAAATELFNAGAESFIKRLHIEQRAWQVLTAEQKAKAKRLMKKRHEKMHRRMYKRLHKETQHDD